MDLKRLVRFVPTALAFICFIGSVYVFAFVQVGFKGPKPAVLLQLSAVLAILMGVFVALAGLLMRRDESSARKKAVTIVIGLLIALAAAAWYFFGIPAA